MNDYSGPLAVAKASSEPTVEVGALRRDWRKRCRAWLSKTSDSKALHPRKRQRTKAKSWLQGVDRQIALSSAFEGLKSFCLPEERAAWPQPLDRPLLSVCCGQGCDGVSALMWLLRTQRCNLDIVWDPSHGVQRDLVGIIKSSNLWSHERLMMLTWNSRHGPWTSKQRAEQIGHTMDEYFELMSPSQCPLFQELLKPILRDREEEGRMAEQGIADIVWDELRELDGIRVRRGEVISFNRFMGMLREGRREDKRWHSRLHSQLITCMQNGMFSDPAFDKVMVRARRSQPDGGDGCEEERATAIENRDERVLKRACQNVLVLSTLMLADPLNQARQRCILCVLEPHEAWHSTQNRSLRSTTATAPWLLKQIKGDFWAPLVESSKQLGSWASLQYIGITSTPQHIESAMLENGEGASSTDDELSKHLGSLVLSALGHRLRRCLWMVMGWGCRSLGLALPTRFCGGCDIRACASPTDIRLLTSVSASEIAPLSQQAVSAQALVLR